MGDQLSKQLLSLRIIAGSMILGLIAFSVVALATAPAVAATDVAGVENVLYFAALLIAIGEFVAFQFIRKSLARKAWRELEQGDNQDDPAAVAIKYYAQVTIIGCAMAEGVGFLGATIVLLSGRPNGLIAAGCSLVVIVLMFPTCAKLATFSSQVAGRIVDV